MILRIIDWKIIVRPWRALRRTVVMFAITACTMTPMRLANSGLTPAAPPVDPHRVAVERAYGEVDIYLAPRMPTLDQDRRKVLAKAIVDESIAKQFDPLFVLAVIEAESNYDHEAVSPTGAKGLMQVIPGTWNLVTERYGLGKLEKFNPVNSVRVGISYLHLLVSSGFKRPEGLLLAYNQGPGTAVEILSERSQPNEEAQTYGPKIMTIYRRLLKEHRIVVKDPRKLYRNPFGSLVRV